MASIRAVLVLCVAAQMVVPGFRQDRAVVLPADSTADFRATFYRWCSRAGPLLRGFWTPDPDAIRALEAALAPMLDRELAHRFKDSSHRPGIHDYYRQYVGIHVGRRRVIYVNGFHRLHVEHLERVRPELTPRWRTQVVHVCDGGTLFFGAEYDPETREIKNLHFNAPG